ncbi:hypothetical protein BDV96DRAFT_648458 [Lophiotrema nucula]|uniref:C2H2-type domain-containing protein n=1 Tax=Lophiotrema nucula TaxID=690887 RepID=A0A6A5Z060_9PLEO|nr:hypothetical protein BDV96DRAFT_648458 [Lophiotrema nucula]
MGATTDTPATSITHSNKETQTLQSRLTSLRADKSEFERQATLQDSHARSKTDELSGLSPILRGVEASLQGAREVGVGREQNKDARIRREKQLKKDQDREQLLELEVEIHASKREELLERIEEFDHMIEYVQKELEHLLAGEHKLEVAPDNKPEEVVNDTVFQRVKKEDEGRDSPFEIVPESELHLDEEDVVSDTDDTDVDIKTPDEEADDPLAVNAAPQLQPLISEVIAKIRKTSITDHSEQASPAFVKCPTGHGSDSSRQGSRSSSAVQHTRQSSSTSRQPPQKRPRKASRDNNPDNNSSDEEDDDDRPRKNSAGSYKGAVNGRRLKCPYYQKDPWKHTRGSCRGVGFQDMAKLKDHLKRVHTKPLQCTRCWRDMPSPQDYDDHLRSEIICTVGVQSDEDDRISPQKLSEINFNRRPYAQAASVEAKWRILFRKLFSDVDANNIPSPYDEYGTDQGFDKHLADKIYEELSKDLPPGLGLEHILSSFKEKLPNIILQTKRRSLEKPRRATVVQPSDESNDNTDEHLMPSFPQASFSFQPAPDLEETEVSPLSNPFLSTDTLATYQASIFSAPERPTTTSTGITSFPSSVSLAVPGIQESQARTLKRRPRSMNLSDPYTEPAIEAPLPTYPHQISQTFDFDYTPTLPNEDLFMNLQARPQVTSSERQRAYPALDYATGESSTAYGEIPYVPYSCDIPESFYAPYMQDFDG